MSLSSIPSTLRVTVAERDDGQCQYCHLRQVGQAATFHIDHIWPRSRGGETAVANLALQCPSCSVRKSNKIVGVDPVTGHETPLFHPCRHDWSSHFSLAEDGSCMGQTPIGRATVDALAMNDPMPKVARSLQMILGLL